MRVRLLIAGLLGLLWAWQAQAAWYSREEAIMGTRISVQLWSDDSAAAEEAIDAVMAEMHRIDALMSPFKTDSQLARVNREAAERPVPVSPELFELVRRALRVSVLSGGAFDITFASVGYAYDYRNRKRPDEHWVRAHLDRIDYRHVDLDEESRTIRFRLPGVRIDLGGIAKGHAVDRAIALLKQRGIRQALVSAGGDSRLLGDHRGRPWNIGIRDPRRKDTSTAVLPLADTAISTSGDYERYFEAGGRRYHHILSPSTGRSVDQARSVTILGPDATTTDALSTSVFVLGPERGMALVERLPGIDAVIVDAQGRMHFSSGLEMPSGAKTANMTP
ncbi:MAG TPA: FAD:protein FMN transferase [Chromatiales bacterium]|nr:FAD:protein FMN transferase [Chromatiales bacterium]